jgi:hypothetical protein
MGAKSQDAACGGNPVSSREKRQIERIDSIEGYMNRTACWENKCMSEVFLRGRNLEFIGNKGT